MSETIDPVRELVKSTLAERRLNMSTVSRGLGKNHAYLHQFLTRGIPDRLPETVREKLAAILQVPEVQLKGGIPKQGNRDQPARIDRQSTPTSWDKMPVHGMSDETNGSFPWTGQVVDQVARPPHVAGAIHAYAVYVAGSTMEPRYYEGDIVYVHPGRPITLGAFVLVQIHPKREGEAPSASIRRVVKRTAAKVTFEQFNPPKLIDTKMDDILSMHRIVGSAESGAG